MKKVIVLLIATLIVDCAYPLDLDIGFTLGRANINNDKLSGGVNLSLLWGRRGNQFGIAGKKYFRKYNENYQVNEMIDLFFRFSNISFGGFYGGYTGDAENFLNSFDFSSVSYQYGPFVELFFPLSSRINIGIEGRHHIWEQGQDDSSYQSIWLNLKYLFSW